MEFNPYKQFIKDYQKYGDVVKAHYDYDPKIEQYLFQWMEKEN